MTKPKVYVLYGLAVTGEPLCMFFANVPDRTSFRKAYPGNYRVLTLKGAHYDDLDVVLPR